MRESVAWMKHYKEIQRESVVFDPMKPTNAHLMAVLERYAHDTEGFDNTLARVLIENKRTDAQTNDTKHETL